MERAREEAEMLEACSLDRLADVGEVRYVVDQLIPDQQLTILAGAIGVLERRRDSHLTNSPREHAQR